MATDKTRDVDAAIDAVARALTGGAPPDALRHDVQRRIASPAPGTMWPRAWAAAAVVATLVVAGLWQVNRQPPVSTTQVVAVPRSAVSPAVATAPRLESVDATASTHERAPMTVPAARRVRVERQRGPADAPSTVDIPALAIAPIAPASIELDAVAVANDVDIDPIAIRPLALGGVAGNQVE